MTLRSSSHTYVVTSTVPMCMRHFSNIQSKTISVWWHMGESQRAKVEQWAPHVFLFIHIWNRCRILCHNFRKIRCAGRSRGEVWKHKAAFTVITPALLAIGYFCGSQKLNIYSLLSLLKPTVFPSSFQGLEILTFVGLKLISLDSWSESKGYEETNTKHSFYFCRKKNPLFTPSCGLLLTQGGQLTERVEASHD